MEKFLTQNGAKVRNTVKIIKDAMKEPEGSPPKEQN